MPNQDSAPASLDRSTLEAPVTRMNSSLSVQAFAQQLINNDCERSWKRARVNGLIDGRPPYKASKLREAGRSESCNVNWGRARSYMESGGGQFYDLFSEAPSYMTVITSYGTPEQREAWSNSISAAVDTVLRESEVWDYEMQLSIDNMVLHGCGPMLFEDCFKCLPKAFLCGDLKVPEFSKSDTTYWDAGMVQATYYPPELYEFIMDEEYAKRVGWDVEHTKRVIAYAMGYRTEAGINYEWEFYQQELKNNSLNYYDDSRIVRLAHVFWKEFDGRITHSIVERDSASGLETKFLYLNIGRYRSFKNLVHPMYFDHGNGGYHHSVTGLGVKMYGPMEYENRTICNIGDKAFAPKILFKPGSAEATQRIQMARFGDYGVLPKGTDYMQTPVQGLMNDTIEFFELMQSVNADTLGTYKNRVQPQTSGNPPTAFQKQMEAVSMSSLSKTQLNRYYKQLDMLYAEIYRRLSNLNTTCPLAKRFQQLCEDESVPREAFTRIAAIQSTRVAGQGSGFMRKMAIDDLFTTVAGALPEDGRANLLRDKIASTAGQHSVQRYFPQLQVNMATDQEVNALTEVSKMKQGIPSKPASSQNPVIYAGIFIKSAMQSIQSIQKGGDPHDVLRFLTLVGPAIGAHLQRIQHDPTRKGIFDQFKKQLQAIGKAADQLKKALIAQSKQQQAQQQRQQGTMSDIQLKQTKLKADIALKQQKQNATLAQRAQAQRFTQALQDADQAHSMTLNRIRAFEG